MINWLVNRRQFIQMGAALGGAMNLLDSPAATICLADQHDRECQGLDPFLQLAWRHDWIDHEPELWAAGMRLCLQLPRTQAERLPNELGEGARVANQFNAGEHTWATVWCDRSMLERWHGQRQWQRALDHLWGAPWIDHRKSILGRTSPRPVAPASDEIQGPGARPTPKPAQGASRCLLIDHGFPLEYLNQQGVAYRYRASLARESVRQAKPAYSHGAQVLGLLLGQPEWRQPAAKPPLLLYELPDELLGSMPLGSLWPDVLDAVCWALSDCATGSTLTVLLSVVSTDGDRHPQSFISRSARALVVHAQNLGVRLRWLMAAGNSHADRQNMSWNIPKGESVEWLWHMPAQNHRPSFLECWHDAAAGDLQISVQPPVSQSAGNHAVASVASRFHPESARIQTVLRLPPTAGWQAQEAVAAAGAWRVRMQARQACRCDVHLSMVANHSSHLFRQAWLEDLNPQTPNTRQPITLSGLVPWMPEVWVAQCLKSEPGTAASFDPRSEHLSEYSGRWPEGTPTHGLRAIGIGLDESPLRRGVLALSANGNRLHRVSGTSMAVPLAARALL